MTVVRSHLAFLSVLCGGVHAVACTSTMREPAGSASMCGASEVRFSPVELKTRAGAPPLAVVAREGNPQAAGAFVVATSGGGLAATGLATLVEQRLRAQGWAALQVEADGQGFRVAVGLDDESRAAAFVAAARAALATPVSAKTAELPAVAQRLAVLQKRALASNGLAAITACTGELALTPSEAATAGSELAAGAERVDAWREASFELGRIAFGATGPASLGKAMWSAMAGESWPSRARSADAWPASDSWSVYAWPGHPAGSSRIDIALWVGGADRAVSAAARLGRPDSALVARLAALPVPFRVVELAGVARSRGGCLAASLETVRTTPAATGQEAAALAAAVARQEFEREQERFQWEHASRGANPSLLDGPAAGAARSTWDPRQASARAAWWSLTDWSRNAGSSRLALSLGIGTPTEPREGTAEVDASSAADSDGRRLRAAFEAAEASLRAPLVDHRERVETGQGELWVLLASPCGTGAEATYDAGQTALALLTRIADHERDDTSVTIEPWITADGLGLLAHAPRLRDESPAGHAFRVSEQAGRAFVSAFVRPDSVTDARARLLDRIATGPAPDGRVMAAAVGLLAPLHPSWLSPLGTWEGVLRVGMDAISARWQAILEGPIRVAVLANEHAAQAEAAVAAVDRWLTRRPAGATERACPAVEPPVAAKAGSVTLDFPSVRRDAAQAIVAAPAPAEGQPNRLWFELVAAALNGPTGLLRRTFPSSSSSSPSSVSSPSSASSSSPTATARLLGGARAAALVIDIRAAEGAVDAAVSQVRELLRKLRQGGLTASDLDRAMLALRTDQVEASFDPRRRVADLWTGRASAKNPDRPSLEAWQGWLASGLADERLVVVVGKPKH